MFGNPPPPPPPRQLPPAKADKKLMGTLEPVGPKVVLKATSKNANLPKQTRFQRFFDSEFLN